MAQASAGKAAIGHVEVTLGPTVKVLFARPGDHTPDMCPSFELPTVPRVGELVSLLPHDTSSFADHFVVKQVQWTPDHTAWDVTVVL